MGSRQPLVTQQGGGRATNRAGHPAPVPGLCRLHGAKPDALVIHGHSHRCSCFTFQTQTPAAALRADACWSYTCSHIEKTRPFLHASCLCHVPFQRRDKSLCK